MSTYLNLDEGYVPNGGYEFILPHAANAVAEAASSSTNRSESSFNPNSDLLVYGQSSSINSVNSPRSHTSTSSIQQDSPVFAHGDNHHSLRTFLENDIDGRVILSSFKFNEKLLPQMQSLLSRRIILNELQQTSSKTIPKSRFEFLAKEIVNLFPSEEIDLWYFSVKCENGLKISPGGKLYNSFVHYKKTVFRKEIKDKNLSSNLSPITVNTDTEKIEFLKKNTVPLDTIYEYWNASYNERKEILSNCSGISDYINTFPLLRQTEHAKKLYRYDFNNYFADKNFSENHFIECWRQDICPKLKKIIISEISLPKNSEKRTLLGTLQNEESDQDIIDGIIFLELPFLIKPIFQKRNGKNAVKPSLLEVRDAFVLTIQNSSDITQLISDRRELLRKRNQTFQPTPIFVGEIGNFHAFYVALNDQLFEVTSPLEAVELTFHLFFALNAEYPAECRLIWQFFQHAVFKVKLPADKHSVTLATLLSKVRVTSI